MSRHWRWITLSLTLAMLGWGVAIGRGHRRPVAALMPYHDAFAHGQAGEWTPLGGFWRLHGDAVINGSDAAGSKLIMGSPEWSDYAVTTDLRLLAHDGDVGVIVRVHDATVGVNAYRGYYVGLRSRDASLVLGRANYSWLEARPVPMGERVPTGRWFRLYVVVVGCTVAVEALDLETGARRYAAMQDGPRQCIANGQIGLRSTDTGSAWRHVSVAKASEADLQALLAQAPPPARPMYPISEHDLYALRMQLSGNTYPFQPGPDKDQQQDRPAMKSSFALPVLTAAEMRTASPPETSFRFHGVVSSIAPFYLQDATGGVRFIPTDPGAFCIGDEVDAVGHLSAIAEPAVFVLESIAEPRQRAPLTAVSLSPTEAASGLHQGSLAEVTGKLLRHHARSDGATILDLSADEQNFQAILPASPFASQQPELRNGSTVRLRGIVSVDSDQATGNSFVLLLQSSADIVTSKEPSWLEGWRLVVLLTGGALLACLCAYLALRSARARMRAVLAERERLSHEVHDTLAQSFAGISFRLQGLRKRARASSLPRAQLIEELDEVYEVVSGTHREASAIIAALRPGGQEDGDLLTLIAQTTEHLFAGHGLQIHAQREGTPRALDPRLKDALFRIALEGVANVLRHSQATKVELLLAYGDEAVTLRIEDNGIGFTSESAHPHFGLFTMQKRCEMVKAHFDLSSVPGRGTRLSVVAPHRRRMLLAFGAH